MNLQAITAGAVGAINPPVLCDLRVSVGYAIGGDGTQAPAYAAFTGIPCQVQALTYSDLMKTGGTNQQGTRRAIYMQGNIEGLDRQAIKGGDLIVMPDLPDFPGPTTWLVAQAIEHWPGWSKLAVTLQNGG